MFRSALNTNSLKKTFLQISKQNRNQFIRWQSTNDKKNKPLKVGLMVGSSVVVISGVAIAYAKYDKQFRIKMQNSIPYSELLLNSLIGPIVDNKEHNISSISDSKDKAIESSLLRKKQERDKSLQQSVTLNTKTTAQKIDPNANLIINNLNKSQDEEPSLLSSSKIEETDEKPETPQTNPSKEGNKEENSGSPIDPSILDMDVTIVKEALKDQLFNLVPTDTEKLESYQQEMQKKFDDLELKYERKILKLKDQFEEDSRLQLKRQLSAFNDHLQEQLSTLSHELKRKYQNSLEEKIFLEKSRFQSELSDSFYKLNSIEAILKVREQLDKDERVAKELWLLSQTLRDALLHSPSMREECLPRSLSKEISAIKNALNKNLSEKPLIKLALESIPNDVIQNGVYSEEDLIKRFTKVDRICKRVALIGDNGGSLYKYILSYLQSILVFSDSKIPLEELEDQEIVDPSKWDTFDILTRVRHCLTNHNLEMALRYANQLRGEPRNVAQDWIRDTRTHLETKQAVDLLQSEASSINVQVLN